MKHLELLGISKPIPITKAEAGISANQEPKLTKPPINGEEFGKYESSVYGGKLLFPIYEEVDR